MKMSMAKKQNIVVLNKVNGFSYVTTKVGNAATVAAKVTEDERCTSDGKIAFDKKDTVTITEENALCFRFLRDLNPETKPEGYTVSNGQLLLGSEKVTEQGEIKVVKILAEVIGKLILITESSAGKFISTYRPSWDKFEKAYSVTSENPSVYTVNENTVLIADEEYRDVKAEDGTVLGQSMKTRILRYENDRWDSETIDLPIDGLVFVEPYYILKFSKTYKDGVLVDATEKYLGIFNDDLEEIETVYPGEEVDAVYSKFTGTLNLFGKNTLVYDVTNNNIMYKNNEFEKLGEKKTLIDVTTKEYETTYTFASTDYRIAKVKVQKTKDRGNIITVESVEPSIQMV